jgi:hypothetical protein
MLGNPAAGTLPLQLRFQPHRELGAALDVKHSLKSVRDFIDDIVPLAPLENMHLRITERIAAPLDPLPVGGRSKSR